MQHRLWDWMLRVSFGCDNSLAHVPVLAVSEVLWNLWVYTDPTTLPMTCSCNRFAQSTWSSGRPWQ